MHNRTLNPLFIDIHYFYIQEAGELVEMAYNEYANQGQRAALVEEFYGPSFSLFKVSQIKPYCSVWCIHFDL